MSDIVSLLAELADLSEKYPEKAKEIFSSDAGGVFLDEMHKAELAQACQEFSSDGFCAHYELFSGIQPPKHVKRWIEKTFKAHDAGRGFTLRGFRGCWKTTSFGVHFLDYFIAHFPLLTNMIVCANDDSAEKIMKAASVIIEHHPNWGIAYPNVKPDTARGWSVNGYYVMDTSLEYGEWTKKRATIIDPTLVGGGLESTRINGKHPSGILYCDDVHDINNSRSKTERSMVVKRMTSVVLKTVIRKDDKLDTWVVVTGVPWAKDDVYQLLAESGQYDYEVLPAMRRAQEGEEGAVYIDGYNKTKGVTYDDVVGWWVLAWAEKFGVNSIMFERSLSRFEFWQMIMMDVDMARSGSLKYYSFPADEIKYEWPVQGGADPTNVVTPANEGARRSSFALTYVAERPQGGAVVVDGVLEPCSLVQAENHILAAQTRFPAWKGTAVENVGGGAMFLQAIRRNPKVRAIESGLKGISDKVVKSKADRIEQDMARYFEDGTVLISDANTPFLNALRSLFEDFYDLDPKHSEEFDAGDSVFHALRNMPRILRQNVEQTDYPGYKIPRKQHPLMGIRDYVGYGR